MIGIGIGIGIGTVVVPAIATTRRRQPRSRSQPPQAAPDPDPDPSRRRRLPDPDPDPDPQLVGEADGVPRSPARRRSRRLPDHQPRSRAKPRGGAREEAGAGGRAGISVLARLHLVTCGTLAPVGLRIGGPQMRRSLPTLPSRGFCHSPVRVTYSSPTATRSAGYTRVKVGGAKGGDFSSMTTFSFL